MVVLAGHAKCCIEQGCGGDSGARTVVGKGGGPALSRAVVWRSPVCDAGHCLLPLGRWALAVRLTSKLESRLVSCKQWHTVQSTNYRYWFSE